MNYEWRQNDVVGHDNPARNDDQNDVDNDSDTAIRDIPNPPKVGGSECSQSQ